ncbi:hypothetical protein D3C85_1164120 [compost metagenome]
MVRTHQDAIQIRAGPAQIGLKPRMDTTHGRIIAFAPRQHRLIGGQNNPVLRLIQTTHTFCGARNENQLIRLFDVARRDVQRTIPINEDGSLRRSPTGPSHPAGAQMALDLVETFRRSQVLYVLIAFVPQQTRP